jgi:hypothetical protein
VDGSGTNADDEAAKVTPLKVEAVSNAMRTELFRRTFPLRCSHATGGVGVNPSRRVNGCQGVEDYTASASSRELGHGNLRPQCQCL